MARADAEVIVNSFQGGLVTEASALNFPDGFLSEAKNVRINDDGSVSRRKGLQEKFNTVVDMDDGGYMFPAFHRYQKFEWPQQDAYVLRHGDSLLYYRPDPEGGSPTLVDFHMGTTISTGTENISLSFSKDRIFLASLGVLYSAKVSLDSSGIFTGLSTQFTQIDVKVRDFIGVPNYDSSYIDRPDDYRSPVIDNSVYTITKFQQYNYFNAGWPSDHDMFSAGDENGSTASQFNPLLVTLGTGFTGAAVTTFSPYVEPALGDSYNSSLSSAASSPKAVGAYSKWDLLKNKSTTALRGRLKVSLFDRLSSISGHDSNLLGTYHRDTEWSAYLAGNSFDTRSQGTAVGFALNRLWVGGVDVAGVESNVCFSQVLTDNTDNYPKMYQENDPTDPEISQVLATDGGTLNIENAGKVYEFIQYKEGVLMFAAKGIWYISGSNGEHFSATGFSVEKITEVGCVGQGYQTLGNGDVYCLNKSSLLRIAPNQFGKLEATDLSAASIKSRLTNLFKNFYNLHGTQLLFDSRDNRLHILFKDYYEEIGTGIVSNIGLNKSLVYDAKNNAWYEKDRGDVPGGSRLRSDGEPSGFTSDPRVVYTGAIIDPYLSSEEENLVYYGVFTGNFPEGINGSGIVHFLTEDSENYYDNDPSATYESIVSTGDMVLGNAALDKQVSYIETFFKNPLSIDSDSCQLEYIQSWDLKNTTTPVEVIRYEQYPVQTNHDNNSVLQSLLKLPGKWRSLKLKYSGNQPDKGFTLLGYSLPYSSSIKI